MTDFPTVPAPLPLFPDRDAVPARFLTLEEIARLRQGSARATATTPPPHRYLPGVLPFSVDTELIAWIESLQPFGPFAYDPFTNELVSTMLVTNLRNERARWEAIHELVRTMIVRHERDHHAG